MGGGRGRLVGGAWLQFIGSFTRPTECRNAQLSGVMQGNEADALNV